MSYAEIGLKNGNNREPDCFPQQQLHRKCPANNTNNNNNNEDNGDNGDNKSNNDAEMMIGENSKHFANGIQLDSTDVASNAIATSNSIATSNVKSANGDAIQNSNNKKADGEILEAENLVHRCSKDDMRRNDDTRKCKFSIKHETVIVSRIDRILDSSGERTSLYKCHLCGKLGTSLEKVRRHLVAHSRRLPFQCLTCDARFQLRPQLSFHVKTEHHPDTESDRLMEKVPVNPVTQSPDSCVNGCESDRSSSLVGKNDHTIVIVTREPITVSKSLACDSGVIKTGTDVTINYLSKYSVLSGADSPKDYSSTVASVRAAVTSSQNQTTSVCCGSSSVFTLCQTNDDLQPPSKGGATAVHDNESHVDSSMGMDMTCRSMSQQNENGQGQGQGQGEQHQQQQQQQQQKQQQHVRSGADVVETALHNNSTRSRGVGAVVAVDLATKIRETEHLSDDVTVVIPSDVPLNRNEAKRDGDGSEPTTCSLNKIIHAPPHKSILGNSHHLRTKRKLSSSGPTSQQSAAEPPAKMTPVPHAKHPTPDYMAVTSPAALPMSVYNPLALSGFVQGFGGLMSSSLLSPIITQTPLGFPGMLVNPLSLYAAQLSSSSIASLMNAKTAVGMPVRDGGLPGLASQAKIPGDGAAAAAAGSRIKEELPCSSSSSSNGCCSSTSDGYASPNSKCSSLSRTHSRLNVIQKPIKRENAYKPIVMSDGRTAYHCLYCNKNFCTISDVNRHMDFHEDIRPYKCRFCSYYARTNSQLKVHMMRHQGIRDFLCRLCNYKGVTQSDLNRHTKSQIHMMKERNVCALCREGFVSPMNLEQHRIEKHFKLENCSDTGVKYHLTMAGLVKENAAN